MNGNITYSLRVALTSYVPELTEAQLIYDGAAISNTEKPFATVEYLLSSPPELLSAGRQTYSETYNFQVGLFAQDVFERSQLESKVKQMIRQPNGIPYYEYNAQTQNFEDSGDRILVDVGPFTPISNDDFSKTTFNHRGYFDMSVEIQRKTGESTYTQ